ncbi:hypothetical protein Plhal304r1_c027g0090391 [Plasmopara halstedii]
MLDELKDLLCEAAVRSRNQALVKRMKNAYVICVTLENSTQRSDHCLIVTILNLTLASECFTSSRRNKKIG